MKYRIKLHMIKRNPERGNPVLYCEDMEDRSFLKFDTEEALKNVLQVKGEIIERKVMFSGDADSEPDSVTSLAHAHSAPSGDKKRPRQEYKDPWGLSLERLELFLSTLEDVEWQLEQVNLAFEMGQLRFWDPRLRSLVEQYVIIVPKWLYNNWVDEQA